MLSPAVCAGSRMEHSVYGQCVVRHNNEGESVHHARDTGCPRSRVGQVLLLRSKLFLPCAGGAIGLGTSWCGITGTYFNC